MRTIQIIFMFMFVSACSRQAEDLSHSSHTFTIFEENGIIVAESTGPPKYPGLLFEFEEILKIQPSPSIEEAILAVPSGLNRDEVGNYYLVDGLRSDSRVVVFNHKGEYLRTIGRIGDGPGEFRRPRLQRIQGDVLEVFDEGSARTSLFYTNGNLIGTFSLFDRLPRMEALYYADHGKLVAVQYEIETDMGDFWRKSICTIQSPGEIAEVILETDPVLQMRGAVSGYASDGSPLYIRSVIRFSGAPSINCPTGSEIILSTGEEPVIQYYDLTGGLVREVRLSFPPESVTNQERRTGIWETRESAQQLPETSVRIKWSKLVNFRDPKAYWRSVDVDNYGYLWLEYPRVNSDQVSASHRLLSPEGEYLGDVRVPHAGGKSRHGEYLVLIRDSETDESVPTVFRMIPVVEGFRYPPE